MGALLANLLPGTANESTPEATDAELNTDELNVGAEYVKGAPNVSVTNDAREIEPFCEDVCVDTLDVEIDEIDGVEAALPYMLVSAIVPEAGTPAAIP
jgi:hypothetical protein